MPQVNRRRGRRYWGRILLANFAGALAVVGVSGGLAPSVRFISLVRALAVSMVYANIIGTLLALTMPRVAGRCWERPARARWAVLLASMAIVTIAGMFVANALLYAVGYVPRGRFLEWMVDGITTALVISLIIGVSVTAYESLRGQLDDAMVALRTKERDEAEARRLAAEAQLASIESRVQPHFLFNTLNSIAALVHDDPAGAERMTGQLAALLRSALDSTATPLVTLDDELRVVRAYLDIERVRFSDRLRYTVQVPDGAGQKLVPRMAVQTLVENSVKFAVSPRRAGASITVRISLADGRLKLAVEDDGPGFDPGKRPVGHGLDLLAGRLAMLFGDEASMRVESQPGRTAVTLAVPQTGSQTVSQTVSQTGSQTVSQTGSKTVCDPVPDPVPHRGRGAQRPLTPMRAYLVDDERLAVDRLKRLLQATGRVTIAGTATDPEEALEFLRTNPVDVLFLDIQMPGLTGFELLEQLGTNVPVVFTTAYDRYAIEAFAVNSIDYLLKPIDAGRLDKALDKLARFAGQPPPDVRALARELAAELAPNRRLERIASRVGERTTVLDVARIGHFTAKDKLSFAVVNGREHVIDYTLNELEARLDPRRFARIHRATIVNLAFVQELFPAVDGGVLVRLKDEQKTELSVARDRVRELKGRLGI